MIEMSDEHNYPGTLTFIAKLIDVTHGAPRFHHDRFQRESYSGRHTMLANITLCK